MGGYQLAGELSASQEMVRYAGLVIAATLGCTITFTIPVGMGMLKSGDRLFFSRGMLIGTGTLPVTMIVGGLLSGLSFLQIVLQSLPVLLFCFLLMFGIWRFPEQTVRAFTVFADVIRLLTTIGLIAGAFCYMTGFSLLPDLAPLEDAMAVVSSIGIVLLGAFRRQEAFTAGAQKAALFYWKKNRHERQQCRRPSDGHCQPCSSDHNDGKNGRARKDCKHSFPRLRRIDHRRTYGIYVRHRS